MEAENARTYIHVRTPNVNVDQITSTDRNRTYGLIGFGLTVDTLDGRVNPEHLRNITLQDISFLSGHESLSDIELVKEDVEHVGEGWGTRKGFKFRILDKSDENSHLERVQQKHRP